MTHNTETPTGHRSTIISLPLLILFELLHWTHHPNALSIPTLPMPHISISVKARNTETPTGHHTTIISSLLPPYPSTHHAGLININTDGLVTAYMHQYHDTAPTPSLRQALGYDTDCPVMVILAQCCICTARCRHLRFHMATTSRGGPPDSTLTRH
jgi:hypothetical protein